jgi:hypothetical protein
VGDLADPAACAPPPLALAPGFRAPLPTGYDALQVHIETALPAESPVVYGMHPNAELSLMTSLGETLFRTLIDVGGGSGGACAGAGAGQADWRGAAAAAAASAVGTARFRAGSCRLRSLAAKTQAKPHAPKLTSRARNRPPQARAAALRPARPRCAPPSRTTASACPRRLPSPTSRAG